MLFGAHMSIAGGYFKAVEAARKAGCQCVQLFTKNNNQWRAKPLTPEDAQKFSDSLAKHSISHPISHASYLINLASPDPELWAKSIDAMVVELQRAEALGVFGVVVHPGAYTTSTVEAGIARVVQATTEVLRQTPDSKTKVVLETTAGQGSCLGARFEELAEMIAGVSEPQRVGVCLDTCHVFAAGYDLRDPKSYRDSMRQFEKTIGFEKLDAIHLNDSVKPLGSRVDRHAHIGQGMLGDEAFRLLLADRRVKKVPMYLETPKGQHEGEDLDVLNLRRLRSLMV